MRIAPCLLAAAMLLAGCGGGDGNDRLPADERSSTPVPAEKTTGTGGDGSTPESQAPALPGAAANGDLSGFACVAAGGGRWKASGVITNPSSRTSDYRITVIVGPADAGRKNARRRILPRVSPDKAITFSLDQIPVASGGTPVCRVQVVRYR